MVRTYLLERVDAAAAVRVYAEGFEAAVRISRGRFRTSAR